MSEIEIEMRPLILLTRLHSRIWRQYCHALAENDEGEVQVLDASLESVCRCKVWIEFFSRESERRIRRVKAALRFNAKELK